MSPTAQVSARTQTRWNWMRWSRSGSRARTDPSDPRTTRTSLASSSDCGAESAHARCHAQLMNGDGDLACADNASHVSGPSAEASDSDIRVTPVTRDNCGANATLYAFMRDPARVELRLTRRLTGEQPQPLKRLDEEGCGITPPPDLGPVAARTNPNEVP